MEKSREHIKLEEAYRELQIQLEESNDIIHAIRSGEVDALIVDGKDGQQLFTLKSADQSYRIFIEQMTESALTLDFYGRISYCNSQFADLCLIPLERVIGSDFIDFIDIKDKELAKDAIKNAWEADNKIELRLNNRNKEQIPVQLSLKVLNLDEGTALSVIITNLTDIKKTEQLLQTRNNELEQARKIADELNLNLEGIVRARTQELEVKNRELTIAMNDLKESEDNLQSVFNAGELGSYSLDLKTGRAELSIKFRELYGLPIDGEISWDISLNAVEDEYIPVLNSVLENCITLGNPVDSTYPIRHLVSGDRRWMRVVGKCKRDNEGNAISVYAVIMDVTDQKQDEQRKNDFIAMVSHELKTPLTSMKGYIQILQLKAKQENLSFSDKALEGAEKQITKMTTLINGFLNVSRLESGKIFMDFQEAELTSLVKEVVEEYNTTGAQHQIFFKYTSTLNVQVDRDKLGQVISNLISNAIKYSPQNSNIFIDCFETDNLAIFQIKDEGIGISQTDLPKLFERFYRVENSKTASVSGFGIGLYLSAEIIDRHGGKLWAESKLGEGSIFYFSLPLIY